MHVWLNGGAIHCEEHSWGSDRMFQVSCVWGDSGMPKGMASVHSRLKVGRNLGAPPWSWNRCRARGWPRRACLRRSHRESSLSLTLVSLNVLHTVVAHKRSVKTMKNRPARGDKLFSHFGSRDRTEHFCGRIKRVWRVVVSDVSVVYM